MLWEGIGDAGGERFGAVRTDNEVTRQEARLYGDPRYRDWWAAPDGIERDHDRIARSLALIRQNPGWFARAALARVVQMLDYARESPPLVGQAATEPVDEVSPPSDRWNAPGRTRGLEPRLGPAACRAPALWFAWLRPLVGFTQAVVRESLSVAVLAGLALLGLAAPRRSLLLASVPLAFLLLQAPLHLEFRVTLPMHAVLFLFAAGAWLMAAALARRIMSAPPWTSRSPAHTRST